MRADLSVKGFAQTLPRRIAASATRYEAGEPLHNIPSYTTGTSDVNTFVLAAADTPVIGTHAFGGVAIFNALPTNTGTLVAQTAMSSNPIAALGRIQGKAETAANIDTETELIGTILDFVLIDYSATGASDGGELYTIKDGGVADTSGLTIVEGNRYQGTLECTVDARAYRTDVTA